MAAGAGVTTALLGLGAMVAGVLGHGAPAAHAAVTSGGVKIAYYDQWSIYQNAFYPKNLDTEGIAGKLDYLLYDFENIDPTNLTCFETTKATDPDPGGENDPNAGDGAEDEFADIQKSYDASISVDGVADSGTQALAGNFNQLKKLKAKHPNLKILLSLGGWTYSKYFHDAALTAASRQKFVSSCIDMFIKGNLPVHDGVHGGAGVAAGIFDGIDVDWEYPGSTAGHLGNHTGPEDKADYTALLAEFRSELDAYGSSVGRHLALTAAVPAGQDKIQFIETNKVGQYLDFANVMTYDMHGAWDATGPTNFQDPVYESPSDPSGVIAPGTKKYSTDTAIRAWTTGLSGTTIVGGFPASKLTVGFPFYYRGWTGVPAGGNHGLYQSASGPSPGHTLSGNVPGVAMYKELTGVVDNPADTFYDPASQSAWFYDGTNFYAGDSPQSVQAKADYLHCNGLGGAMMFSLYDLDPGTTLFNKVVTAVNGSAGSCTSPTGGPTSNPPTSNPPTTPISTPPTTGSPPPGTCTAPAWNSSTAYTGGQEVSYNGHTWKAKWWTQGDTPGNNSQDVWTDEGPCGGGSTSPPPAGSCTAPAWNSSTAYTGGQEVTYNGHTWKAKWWTQGDVPGNNSQGVWTDEGACS
ncbi:MAG: glycosyl hydrolase family 18 protein [Mycobacteriales bacterium]